MLKYFVVAPVSTFVFWGTRCGISPPAPFDLIELLVESPTLTLPSKAAVEPVVPLRRPTPPALITLMFAVFVTRSNADF